MLPRPRRRSLQLRLLPPPAEKLVERGAIEGRQTERPALTHEGGEGGMGIPELLHACDVLGLQIHKGLSPFLT